MKILELGDERTWLQKLSTHILLQGPVPQHVGLILDGNRRFAKKSGQKTMEGHRAGSLKLDQVLQWGFEFGIKEITAYAFSIENFKRGKEEVDALMELAEEKFANMLENIETLMIKGVCVQFVGDWTLIPQQLRKSMFKIMLMTRGNKSLRINFAFAYTSRNEIARGLESLHRGIKSGDLSAEDIDVDLLDLSLDAVPSLPLQLIVRTSGESRLSDFLLWQSTESVLCFVDVLWPELSFWNVFVATLQYQVNYYRIKKLKLSEKNNNKKSKFDCNMRQNSFLEKMRGGKFQWLENELKLMKN